ncbi:MAG: hypothetical protein AAFO69_05910 [Bacteroidota bacterium]
MEALFQKGSILRKKKSLGATLAASLIFFSCLIAYTFFINRNDTGFLITLFTVCFGCYLYAATIDVERTKYWKWVGIGLRLVLFLGLPVLSDDYFRFIWDGRLLAAGINPFESLPAGQLHQGIDGINQELFDQLNSTAYFTIYPPLNQLIFWLSAWLFPGSIFGSMTVIRSCVFLADLGNYWLLQRLAIRYRLRPQVALLYFLNPLVILEFTGNLHFESVMIFFILLSIYWIDQKKTSLAGLAMALGVVSKLLPLMYMPAMMKFLSLRKLFIFYVITGIVVILSFLPLISIDFLQGMSSSIDLYFRKFEFNASVYFIARTIGYAITGYNAISIIGPLMGVLTIGSMISYLVFNRHKVVTIAETLLFTHLFYLLFATTVHPWYITTLLALSILTRYRFAVVWSGLVFLTYIGYHAEGFSLPAWVLYLEYGVVFFWLLYEIIKKRELYPTNQPD